MQETRTIRQHVGENFEGEVAGRDEGGPYRLIEVEPLPPKLVRRMKRCGGCHDDFYNHRQNCGGNHCFSLSNDENFRGRGRPRCFH